LRNRLFKLAAVDLGRFVGVSHFGDGADGRLRRQPEVIPKALVNDLLQVELAGPSWVRISQTPLNWRTFLGPNFSNPTELADLLGSEFLKPQLNWRTFLGPNFSNPTELADLLGSEFLKPQLNWRTFLGPNFSNPTELADLLGSEFLKPQLRCRIAGSVARLKSLSKQFCLVLRRCQLDIGHQFHRSNIETAGAKYQVPRFLSTKQELWLEHLRGGFR
jgi:hypothetical protein